LNNFKLHNGKQAFVTTGPIRILNFTWDYGAMKRKIGMEIVRVNKHCRVIRKNFI
jgi:hypothetical protein